MAWPESENYIIKCKGFPETYIPAIKDAIENNDVIWCKTNGYTQQSYSEFRWAECVWAIIQNNEIIETIALLKGKPKDPGLSFAILKGQ